MKEWIKLWLNTEQPSKRDFEELAAAAMTSLADAQKAHISDLRVLIDKGHEREAQLAEMVKLAMESQFYRPTVTRGNAENKVTPAIAPEHLQDVTVFDEAEDAQMVKEQQEELSALLAEQNTQGMHKVGA